MVLDYSIIQYDGLYFAFYVDFPFTFLRCFHNSQLKKMSTTNTRVQLEEEEAIDFSEEINVIMILFVFFFLSFQFKRDVNSFVFNLFLVLYLKHTCLVMIFVSFQ
jgi:hypothetical protein